MADKKIWLGMSILVLTLSLMGIACSSDIPDNTGIPDNTPQATSYIGEDYELKITKNTDRAVSRAAYSPQSGDSYVLRIANDTKSSGTVSIAESNFTFSPSSGKLPFTATFEYGGLIDISSVTLDDNTPISLPLMIDSNYTGGKASTDPEDTGTQIAGCAYSDFIVSGPSTESKGPITHYLLSVSYDQAVSILTESWGEPNTGRGGIDWSATTDAAKHNGGVLFEVGGSSYQLLRWSGITVGTKTSGTWISVKWNNAENKSATDTETTIVGIPYTRRETFNGSIEDYNKNYILSIPYDEALACLIELWGDPEQGWALSGTGGDSFGYRSQAIFGTGHMIVRNSSNEEVYSMKGHRLGRFIDGEWKAVGWRSAE